MKAVGLAVGVLVTWGGVALARAAEGQPDAGSVAPARAVIDEHGVGEVRIGAPLPRDLLGADAEARYVARFIADFVPIEGFRIDTPPVLAVLRGKTPPTGKPGARAARTAVKLARAGKLVVSGVHIEDPGPRTAHGAGVGSTLADLRRAHGDVRIHPVPPTYGGDECVALLPGWDRVWFYFADCSATSAGSRVVRVLVVDSRE